MPRAALHPLHAPGRLHWRPHWRPHRRLLALAMAASLHAAPTWAAPDGPALRLLVYPAPGLFDADPDGRVGGPGGLLLQRIGQASQLGFETEMLPVARVIAVVQAQPGSCLVGMVRTPEREALFQWVGAVSRASLAVYGRDDGTAALPSLAALRGQRVVVIRETANAAQLRELGVAAQEVNGTLNALRMLQAGRVDYWFSHTLVAEPAASAAGGAPLRQLFSTPRIDGYLACNLATPAATLDKLRAGLQRLRQHGDLAEFGLR